MNSGCFITTVVYGSYLDDQVDTLRSFHDQYLMTNSLGQDVINFYYTNSPSVARFIRKYNPV